MKEIILPVAPVSADQIPNILEANSIYTNKYAETYMTHPHFFRQFPLEKCRFGNRIPSGIGILRQGHIGCRYSESRFFRPQTLPSCNGIISALSLENAGKQQKYRTERTASRTGRSGNSSFSAP